ncbi:hypothetical protein HUJ05_007449 [Dendroctonus ponderosae]|nr:hypothetical protein HUJ05_007439 [Dendroctonus ponderosae]KAH1006736.1 hypothetical protein HUJ05_007443 [Dendroctonus ponderosae]KAH1006743.1 hypothetical protein HUJ05_007449 [Dendroctonus ponderosae]
MPKKHKLKSGVTFQLVNRSQQDPLITDENAPQHVLVPISKDFKEKRREEQIKYGVYFDDEFDYLRHLKDRKDNHVHWPDNVEELLEKRKQDRDKPKLELPSSVFPSKVEEDVGMLNKAAPVTGIQLQLDRDIVAAMDEDFDFEDVDNQLEDNFMDLAGSEVSDDALVPNRLEDFQYDGEELDQMGPWSGDDRPFSKPKSRFTEHSVSSSVIRRNSELQLLDARFEVLAAQYDPIHIGSLDTEEIDGYVPLDMNDSRIKACYDEFEQSRAESEESESEEEKTVCTKSDVSTLPKYVNLPTLIDVPKRKQIQTDRVGIPRDVLGNNQLTRKTLGKLDGENAKEEGAKSLAGKTLVSQLSELSIRPKGETSEERRLRKKGLKEIRKQRRMEKKQNTLLFKICSKQEALIALNRGNMPGTKLP